MFGAAAALEEVLSSIERAATIGELKRILQNIAEATGFSAFSFIDGRPGDVTPLVLNTIAPGFDRDYRSEGFVDVDPVIPVWRRSNAPFTWGAVPLPPRLGRRYPGAIRTMMAARDHGYREGLVVPFHYVDRLGRPYSSACTFFWTGQVSEFRRTVRDNSHWLHMVMLYWAQRIVDLASVQQGQGKRIHLDDETPDLVRLTDRERDVLAWAARGKTAQDTAEILGIALDTIGTHMRACLQKLNANNKTHAVAKAIYLRLIDP
ncbi:helix-turn-helix transcriptional regulator [Segnochrobactrum spirostomi]|uniref:LuxR family transcriptional regulator n=1 Tax=Segnochrobactrum spirostomi TaxID=2608987 RepID=A0A6A7Y177_9HYPH|nr:autoinducer binding domain-containing protein [Segnochrobactrum spirostomi]MQT12663.1 LuxR family transcriptional regulator [Segnochrobactrum spirostomi]